MISGLAQLFSTDGFLPRWQCGDWTSLHGWIHVVSDVAIAGAYGAIPAALWYFASKRRDVPFLPIFWLFGAFILACGAGHLIEATLFWQPVYRLSGGVKLLTAIASWATVVALIRILPQALELPGLAKLNRDLSREIAERKQAEIERECALDESRMLLREVHHRVKNNMQVISSLLSLQSAKLQDPEQRAVFSECRERIRAMALIHERLYSGPGTGQIDFGRYLTDMVRMMVGSVRKPDLQLNLDLQLEKVHVGSDLAVPLSLIASELVLNAMKHGFKDVMTGTLTVALRSTGAMNELIVQDDGPGMPVDPPSPAENGIGLDLIESLTRQIRGEREALPTERGVATAIRWPSIKQESRLETAGAPLPRPAASENAV